jgi:hypothetical protein
MELHSNAHIPDGLLATMTLLSEKPRQGVPSRESALNQGIGERNCTAHLGLRFRSSETASDLVDAPNNNGQQPTPQHFWQKPGCLSAIGETAVGVAGGAIEVGAVIYVGPAAIAAATAEATGDAAVSGAALGEAGLNLAHVGMAAAMLLAAPAVLIGHGVTGIAGSCF